LQLEAVRNPSSKQQTAGRERTENMLVMELYVFVNCEKYSAMPAARLGSISEIGKDIEIGKVFLLLYYAQIYTSGFP
jgi:hypothetical protein